MDPDCAIEIVQPFANVGIGFASRPRNLHASLFIDRFPLLAEWLDNLLWCLRCGGGSCFRHHTKQPDMLRALANGMTDGYAVRMESSLGMNVASERTAWEYAVCSGQITDADEPLEEDPGGYACVCTNNLTPIKLTLQPTGLPGKVRLSATGGRRIRLWENADRTGEVVLPKEWNSATNVPSALYVEGVTNSAAACDVTLTLAYDENPPNQNNPLFKCDDKVRLTIIKIDSVEVYCDKFGASGSFGVNPEIFAGGQTDFGQPDQPPPYWWLPGTHANPASQVLKVFFKYIKDSNDEPTPFDIELKANILPESIPDKNLNITWVNWAGPSSSGSFAKTDEREVKFQNPTKGGLYKFRIEMNPGGCVLSSDAWVLLPKAGGEIADWVVTEIPSLITRASDWETAVRAVAVTNGLNEDEFLETAWVAIASYDFDYQGFVGSPTKRYSFRDSDRPAGHTPDPSIPGMAGKKGNGDWDEPSYATLKGIVIHRAKINNAMYAVWGRELGYTENQLKGGAIWNAMSRGLWDDSTSQNAVALGSDLYNAYTSGGSLAAILTKTRAKQIQSPDTPTGLNDVNLWPDTTSVSSGFWLPTMPTDYDSLAVGTNETVRGRFFN